MSHKSYSIWTSIITLQDERKYVLAYAVFAFLVIMPMAFILGAFSLVTQKEFTHKHLLLIEGLGNFVMVDVFTLALVIFLWEGGDQMMKYK